MKTKILSKIVIASALCAPACDVERGVVVCKEELPEENALYVNLIRVNKRKQKPLHNQSDEVFDADRKLLFRNSEYMEQFEYILPGDTISFRNAAHNTYLLMEPENEHIRKINGIREKDVVKITRRLLANQKQK